MEYTHEAFASAVDDVLVLRISADEPGKLNATVSLSRQQDAESRYKSPRSLILVGQIVDEPDPAKGPGGKHMRFAAKANVFWEESHGGEVTSETIPGDKTVEGRGMKAVTIILTAATDYDAETMGFDRDRNPHQICSRILRQADREARKRTGEPQSESVSGARSDDLRRYVGLRHAHREDHKGMFNRVALEVGDSPMPIFPPTNG